MELYTLGLVLITLPKLKWRKFVSMLLLLENKYFLWISTIYPHFLWLNLLLKALKSTRTSYISRKSPVLYIYTRPETARLTHARYQPAHDPHNTLDWQRLHIESRPASKLDSELRPRMAALRSTETDSWRLIIQIFHVKLAGNFWINWQENCR